MPMPRTLQFPERGKGYQVVKALPSLVELWPVARTHVQVSDSSQGCVIREEW